MKIVRLEIHNFRGVHDADLSLDSYTLLVGANNAGKSMVVDALRCFYEKEGCKFSHATDFPFITPADQESWIDLTFLLSESEQSSLADDYKQPDRKLKVRKYLYTALRTANEKPMTGSIFGYKSDGKLSDEPFYGAKNVQDGKFGEVVYIPAVSKVDDLTRLSGPSVLRDLLANVLQDVVEASQTYQAFSKHFETFASQIKTDETGDKRSLVGLEQQINSSLETWGTEFKLKLTKPSADQIIKSMLAHELFDSHHGKSQKAEQFGSGFQRHFIFSLINIGSRYVGKKPSKKTKDFSPSMTLILFEEPEAFLHPPQQIMLAESLRRLSETPDRQVICTTHSPQFVSKNIENLCGMIRLRRENGKVACYQISDEAWQAIVESNQSINAIAKRWPKLAAKLQDEDSQLEMESIKYCLWLNSERCSMFFSNKVLLVEGSTEQAFITRLIADGRFPNWPNIYVLDCIGKFNLHRFIKLLSGMGIDHAVLYDDDRGLGYHKDLNELIAETADPSFTVSVTAIPGDTEEQLNLKGGSDHSKPQRLLYHYQKQKIESERISHYCSILAPCFPESDSKN